MAVNEQRWRYQKQDGTPVWLPFDPAFRCIYCEEPVKALSFGGPAVCGSCDCSPDKDDHRGYFERLKNARRRLEEMPVDPVWQEYEDDHKRCQTPTPGAV